MQQKRLYRHWLTDLRGEEPIVPHSAQLGHNVRAGQGRRRVGAEQQQGRRHWHREESHQGERGCGVLGGALGQEEEVQRA